MATSSTRITINPTTGREKGTFGDVLVKEGIKGGTSKKDVIDRAITKYQSQYEEGYAPEAQGLRARANRVFKSIQVHGWTEEKTFRVLPPKARSGKK